MRNVVFAAVLLAVAGFVASAPALAGGGHGHSHSHVSVGVGFGFGYPGFGYPYWGGPWGPWGYPHYYPAPVVVQQPVTYIEQNPQAAPAPANAGWWYYCDQSRGYYPYVRECPGGWQRVPPTPSK